MSKRAKIGRPKSRKARVLYDALVKSGHTKIRIWWEPIGPALEMCGHSGGYMFESNEAQRNGVSPVPIGLSLDEALDSVPLWAPRTP